MSQERVNFGSKLGMVLATAGSAVGLGDSLIWLDRTAAPPSF